MRNEIIIERPDLAIDNVALVKGNTVIKAGQLIAVNGGGYAGNLVLIGQFATFLGIAQENVDATGKADGELTVRVKYPKILKCKYTATTVIPGLIGNYVYISGAYQVTLNTELITTAPESAKLIGLVVGVDVENSMIIIQTRM